MNGRKLHRDIAERPLFASLRRFELLLRSDFIDTNRDFYRSSEALLHPNQSFSDWMVSDDE